MPPRFELQIIDLIVLMNFGRWLAPGWTQLGVSSTSDLQPFVSVFRG